MIFLSLFAASDTGLGGAKRRLYFTEIGLGTPAKSYYVDVDTGSVLNEQIGRASCRERV